MFYTPRVPLHFHRSNRIERLATRLAEVVRTPLTDPFARECIVVQGPGMERWLSAYLARELGVWANPWFPFPRAVIELFLEAALGPVDAETLTFDPDSLLWSIAKQLPEQLDQPAFREVAAYLRDDRQHERLLELARRLAESFDQYVIYRPELVLRWEQGESSDEDFQAKLFRQLSRARPSVHLARRMRAFQQARVASGVPGERALPERIALFGISTLPPAFMGMLAKIAEQRPVHLFLLTPSREYWGDLDRSQSRRGDLHGFLAQLGKVSREFVDLLETLPYVEGAHDDFELHGHDTMLHALQRDLVELTARARHGSFVDPPLPIREDDESLRIHVCHSVVRELEVLRDQLRARFERDATLQPRDVIVFTPDIERYAPAIEAVFTEAGRDDKSIPFRIADRRTVRASEIAESFFALLELIDSRLHLSDVLDFLHRACVRSRFDIAEVDLDRLQHWLAEAGARWSIDGPHRVRFGQPGFDENSLRFALDRLLVGYAAAHGETRALHGVLPYSEVEGRDALLLGKLARYLETLFSYVRSLSEARAPAEHAAQLTQLLERMLSDEGELGIEHHALRGALAELAAHAERAGFTDEVSLASVRRLLERRLDRGRANVGFLAGGVTFCEPVPMRAIPFRVVCLLGMDDESFPRSSAAPAFDLMTKSPRPGDRTLRDDDRQLFLEALLSARDALHISYVGRSAQDDSERPPSVLVDQLRRVCDQHFVLTDDADTLSLGLEGSVSSAITHHHALHRFDPRYFQAGRQPLFSYDESAARAARALTGQKQAQPAFARVPLPKPAATEPIALEALGRFFRRPQELFLRERLKIYLPRELDDVADREPITLDALERFRLSDELLKQRESLPPDERARLLRDAGRLAPGSVGAAQLGQLETLVQSIVDECTLAFPLPDREIALTLPSGEIRGRLSGLGERERIVRSVGRLHVQRLLGAWIEHLALCASGAAPRVTRVVGREAKSQADVIVFAPVENAALLLEELLQLYRLGMCMPLPLLHEAAECLLRALEKGSDLSSAYGKALAKLNSAQAGQGSLDNPHVLQAWSRDQLMQLATLSASDGEQSASFAEVAERVLGPMLRHMRQALEEEA